MKLTGTLALRKENNRLRKLLAEMLNDYKGLVQGGAAANEKWRKSLIRRAAEAIANPAPKQ